MDHTAPRSPMLEQRFPFRRPHKSPAQHTEDASCLSEDHTRVHLAGDQDRGWERRSREKGGAGDGKEEHLGWKRKYREDEDSHKENRRKARMEPGSAEKSKHRKKSSHDWDTTEEGRRSSREKRHPGRESSQDHPRWLLLILGT
ncbi:hypothetical protein Cadr_000029973 [Camelus dromedarius]|uniref:Uncharacterized protein n=1 Tax=Camelus dromedarius TaxID=9838 RepID=A0A5N4CDE7_CAMDR|nr:hypothetical protein Cadr_000029973 [Camelus dromedarius]